MEHGGMRKKELAKFFAGLTAWEAVVHSSLAVCDMLPLTWCNYTLTNTVNTFQIIIPGTVSILLIWYGWFKKDQTKN